MKVINKPCDVVSSTDIKGNITPHRIRLEENNEFIVIKIQKIVSKELLKLAGKEYLCYTCQGLFHNVIKVFELRFCKSDYLWTLYKI